MHKVHAAHAKIIPDQRNDFLLKFLANSHRWFFIGGLPSKHSSGE